jgi:protein-tyrosine phosphatase
VKVDHADITPVTKVLEHLYVGTLEYARSITTSNPEGIDVVINLCEEPLATAGAGLKIEWLPTSDGIAIPRRKITKILSRIAYHLRDGKIVLVHCRAGQSRSAAFVIGYLCMAAGFDWDAAVAYLAERRWIALHPKIAGSFIEYFGGAKA